MSKLFFSKNIFIQTSRKPLFILIFAFSFLIFLSHTYFTKTAIFADGKFYYATTRSLVKDHNINFENDFPHLNIKPTKTITGYTWNKYPPGVSIAWMPLFSFTDGLSHILENVGMSTDTSGFGILYQSSVALSSIFLGTLALLLILRLLSDYFPDKIAYLAVLTLFGATNLLFYIAVEPINSHAISFFASTLFVYYFLKHKKDRNYYFVLGILGGVAGLVRTQDLLILILPIVEIFLENKPPRIKRSLSQGLKSPWFSFIKKNSFFTPSIPPTTLKRPPAQAEHLRAGSDCGRGHPWSERPGFSGSLNRSLLKKLFKKYCPLLLGSLIGFLPQIYFWKKIFGTFWYSPYLDEGFTFTLSKVLDILFNKLNGLIYITPVIAVSLIGLLVIWKNKNKPTCNPIISYGLIYFLLQLLLVTFWSPSIGGSFSNRMMITTLPLLSFGLAKTIEVVNKRYNLKTVLFLISIFSLNNAVQIIKYLLLY